jgi:hypothetical protein
LDREVHVKEAIRTTSSLESAEKELKKIEQEADVQEVLEKGRLLYKELALAKGLGVSEDAAPEELLQKATSYVPLMADKAALKSGHYRDSVKGSSSQQLRSFRLHSDAITRCRDRLGGSPPGPDCLVWSSGRAFTR